MNKNKDYLNDTADQSGMYVQIPYNRKLWFENISRVLGRNVKLSDLTKQLFWSKLPNTEKERVKKYFN